MLVLTAVLVVPFFIDWTTYKSEFEREASRILGREVVVRGDARARLLPLPSVTFTDVEVAGTEPGEPAVTVETFSMDAELAPFLRGELLIFDMRIVRPKARISIAEDGTVDWALRPSTPFDASQVTLENVTITEGQIEMAHAASGRTHKLTEVNTEISARTLAGPWRVNGSMRLDGALTAFSISTGPLDDSGRMRMRVRAEPERYGFNLEADGNASIVAGAFGYEGTFKIAARKAERLRTSDGETIELEEDEPAAASDKDAPPAYRVSGDFRLDHELFDVSAFRFETGPLADPYMAEGKASITLGSEPRFEIEADGAQLRFQDVAEAGDGSLAFAARLEAFKEVMYDLPTPEIPGSIKVNLPAIVAGDTTVRDVSLAAEPVEGGWSIGAMSATLPGRATLQIENGHLRTTFGDFGLTGKLRLAVRQPSGFAAWLAKDVDEAIRRLPRAGFEADVDLGTEKQVFENLELQLGSAAFRGRIVNEQPVDREPRMELVLDGGALDVEGLAAFASLFVGETGTTRLAERYLDFKIDAGPVTVAGITAENAHAELRLRDGRLEVDKLTMNGVEGADIGISGALDDVTGTPTGKLDTDIKAGDLAPLVALAADRFPNNPLLAALDARSRAYPEIYNETELNVVTSLAAAEAEQRRLRVDIRGTAGGSEISLGLTATGAAEKPYDAALELTLIASNEEPGALYALYGIPAAPFNFQQLPFGVAGALATELELSGRLGEGAATTFKATGEGLLATFDGTVTAGPGTFAASGTGSIEADNIETYLMTAGVVLPGMGLGLPARLTASLDFADDLLIASGLEGSVAGNAISGDINASVRDGLPHFTGAVNLDTLDLGLAAASVLGEASMDMEGGGAWPRIPFEPAATPPFTADLEIAADEVILQGERWATNARMSARLSREGARIAEASAEFNGGTIGGLIELSNNGGTGLFSGQVKASDAPLASLLPEAGLTGRADFSATLTANGKTIEAMMASLAGSGTASVKELVIPGISPFALDDILAVADAAGTDIDNDKAEQFAPELILQDEFATEATEFPLTVAGGVLRSPPVVLERPEAALTVEARADLGAGSLGASGELAYVAGADAVVGAEPSVRFEVSGPPGEVTVRLDTAPLGQFLTQRALEKEQARVEAMQGQLLERQRLRREVRYYASLMDERQRLAEELRQHEEAARAAEEARRAADDARRAAEEEARRLEEEARRQADEEARLRAEEAARLEAEAESSDPAIERETLPPPEDSGAVRGSNMTMEGLLRALEQ